MSLRPASEEVTIVIPTHDRPSKLHSLLLSIREHRPPQLHSVVVVDDSAEAPSPLRDFPDLNLRHIIVGSRLFITKAKNIGWSASESEYVYFIDDDNVVGDLTFRPVFDSLFGSPSVGAVMPGVLYMSRPDLVWVYATPFFDKNLKMNLVGRNMPRNKSLENRLLRTDALPNASLVRRRALEDVGGFDENLVVNSSLDLAQRLKGKGWQVCANTGASIYHDVEVPGKLGWWAAHGSVDPERVRYELRDYYQILRRLNHDSRLFRPWSTMESMKFVLPNLLAYMGRSNQKRRLISSVCRGYVEGMRLAGRPQPSYFL